MKGLIICIQQNLGTTVSSVEIVQQSWGINYEERRNLSNYHTSESIQAT